MKFGGAAFSTPDQFSHIADFIISRKEENSRVVVVVSAMGGTTDKLIQLAKQVNPNPPQRENDMLISVGERISMSLLAMALCHKKQDAVSFTGSQSGIITCQSHSQAQIIDVQPHRVLESANQGKIVIVAGFQGVSRKKEITTLGRGGSDTTAVALALALGAPYVEFYKDVPGLFDLDPKKEVQAKHYPQLTYQDALKIVEGGARILHVRAIQLAAKNGLPLWVRSFKTSYQDHQGTIIGDSEKRREENPLYEI